MTVLATVRVLSSLAACLLFLGGVSFAAGEMVWCAVFTAIGAGWLGIIQASLLRMISNGPAGTSLDRSPVAQDAPEASKPKKHSMFWRYRC